MSIQISPVNVEERKNLDLRVGDRVRVWQKIQEKGKTRLQPFEGLVLARKHGAEAGANFTVRKIAEGVGVERIYPLYSPNIDRIEILRRSRVRRSKIYYLRDKVVKAVRRKLRKSENVNIGTESEAGAAARKEQEELIKQQEEASSNEVSTESENNAGDTETSSSEAKEDTAEDVVAEEFSTEESTKETSSDEVEKEK